MTSISDLDHIRSLHAAITPGPWESVPCDIYPTWILGAPEDDGPYAVDVLRVDSDDYSAGLSEADAAFIAAAPSTVEQLLGALERVEALADSMGAHPEHRTTAARIRAAIAGEGGRECEYCAEPEFRKHKGFCLTIMEGAREQWRGRA